MASNEHSYSYLHSEALKKVISSPQLGLFRTGLTTVRTPMVVLLLVGALLHTAIRGKERPAVQRTTLIPTSIVYLTPYGFLPDRITVPEGQFCIAFRNQTGTAVSIIPQNDGNEEWQKIAALNQRLNRTKWRLAHCFARLPGGGVHSFTEANHPGWVLSVSASEASK